MDLVGALLFSGIVVLLFLTAFYLFTLPIEIGEGKGLSRREMRRIRILTWCGLISGVLWFIALVLALTGEGDRENR